MIIFSKIKSLISKQQTHWNQELNLLIGTEDWSSIYKCNYEVASETKLRLIKLNIT